ncbi:YSIRK-type signal peptide-containing protein [Streptococcus sp. X16XC17]|uniref:GBS Bsp-like repeat-containing protein n=1 Tax=unclassified Streptococcus TaxID=2608887 RepID=UPI00066FE737|nr:MULTISPECIES: GBS Bsp-like repeat-containing protein [unclassified Streptococcus]TCD46431.1 YSIRK-type signal peptide-containing protein [Streptococcus sp. X16XC17]
MKKNIFSQQTQRFSIRKYGVGATSVMIASLLFMGAQSVSADEIVGTSGKRVVTETSELTLGAVRHPQVAEVMTDTSSDLFDAEKITHFEEVEATETSTQPAETEKTVETGSPENETMDAAVDTDTSTETITNIGERVAKAETSAEEASEVRKESEETPLLPKISGTLTIQDQTEKGFDIRVTDLVDAKGIATVKIPVWTTNNQQDDLIWYTANKQADGSYTLSVESKRHKNELGGYNVHLYYQEKDGKLAGITSAKTTLTRPKIIQKNESPIKIPAQGIYTFDKEVEVKNAANIVAKTQFTFQKGERIRYDQVLSADNHQWISYVSYSGTRRFIPIAQQRSIDSTTKATGTLSIEQEENGDFNIIVSNVSDANGIKEVKVPVWTSQNKQDDLKWYNGIKQSDGTYKVAVKLADHKGEKGPYNVHLYYLEHSGKQIGIRATTYTISEEKLMPDKVAPTGQLSVANLSNEGFDLIATNISGSEKISQVRVPVWSDANGQDDLKWYTATKQADNS